VVYVLASVLLWGVPLSSFAGKEAAFVIGAASATGEALSAIAITAAEEAQRRRLLQSATLVSFAASTTPAASAALAATVEAVAGNGTLSLALQAAGVTGITYATLVAPVAVTTSSPTPIYVLPSALGSSAGDGGGALRRRLLLGICIGVGLPAVSLGALHAMRLRVLRDGKMERFEPRGEFVPTVTRGTQLVSAMELADARRNDE
jgi:hypothetical protein